MYQQVLEGRGIESEKNKMLVGIVCWQEFKRSGWAKAAKWRRGTQLECQSLVMNFYAKVSSYEKCYIHKCLPSETKYPKVYTFWNVNIGVQCKSVILVIPFHTFYLSLSAQVEVRKSGANHLVFLGGVSLLECSGVKRYLFHFHLI